MNKSLRRLRNSKFTIVAILFGVFGVVMIVRSQAAPNPNLIGDLNSDNVVNITDLSMLLSNWGKTGTTPPIPPTPPPSSGSVCPAAGSGEAIPTADIGNFKLIFADDFCISSTTGSWASDTDDNKVVYTGNGPTGVTKWTAYPRNFLDTYQKRPYRSDAVLSTHEGMLDFYLHPVDGKPAGANPSPLIDGISKYQTYGRYATRFKVDTPGLTDYHIAWLLWPQENDKGACAESDYPEGGPAGNSQAYHHNDPGCSDFTKQDAYSTNTSFLGWHTYVQEWEPGVRRYYLDGKLIGTSTTHVYAAPERWQMQTETSTDAPNNKAGHLLVDWAAVWKYQP